MANINTQGKAYGFFYCTASKKKIESELPIIREFAQVPSGLEIVLNDIDDFKDPELNDLTKKAKDAGINYVLDATYTDSTNEKTADEVATIFNQMYQSPLYEDGFRGDIVYKQGDEWIFRE